MQDFVSKQAISQTLWKFDDMQQRHGSMTIHDLQAWAQFRLQGRLTVHGQGLSDAGRCLLCGALSQMSFWHLLTECDALESKPQISRTLARRRAADVALLHWWSSPTCAEDARLAVSACGSLHRAALAALRSGDLRRSCSRSSGSPSDQ